MDGQSVVCAIVLLVAPIVLLGLAKRVKEVAVLLKSASRIDSRILGGALKLL